MTHSRSQEINVTSSQTSYNSKTLPQLLAEKEVQELRIRLLNEMHSVAPIELVSRRIDTVQELLREQDNTIKTLLHYTELEQ